MLLNIQTFGVNVKYAKTLSCPSVLSAIILLRTIRFHMIAIQISCLTFLNLVLIEDADVSEWIFSIPVDKCILSFRHVEKRWEGWRGADGQGEGAWEAVQGAGCSQVPLIRSRVQFKIDAFSVVGNFLILFLFRPTEDFDPEQEDWEKAVKVSLHQFLAHFLLSFCLICIVQVSFCLICIVQVCNKILNLDSNDVTAFHCKVGFGLQISELLLKIYIL